MTKDEAEAVLATVSVPEAIPVARAIEMLRGWKKGAIDVEAAIDVLSRLKPTDVIEIIDRAEHKLWRRNRPR